MTELLQISIVVAFIYFVDSSVIFLYFCNDTGVPLTEELFIRLSTTHGRHSLAHGHLVVTNTLEKFKTADKVHLLSEAGRRVVYLEDGTLYLHLICIFEYRYGNQLSLVEQLTTRHYLCSSFCLLLL